MEQERWEHIKDIFEAALALSRERRDSFLIKVCHDDQELLREVRALLESHEGAGSFLAGSAGRSSSTGSLDGTANPTFKPDDTLSGRFRIVRFIGSGGMGEVYEAKDLELGARVALKTLRPEISSDPWALNRFKQEIQLARRVTHPNVCRMFDIARHHVEGGDENSSLGRVFLSMELLEGESLGERLRRQGRMEVGEARSIIQQMAEALHAAHEAGVIHRDFKPSNVVLVSSNRAPRNQSRAVVTDFGLARAAAGAAGASESRIMSLSMTGQLMGTLAYMAPEQLEGREPTPATDIYAFGLVVYEMITGHSPFPEDAPLAGAFLRVKEEPLSPRNYLPEIDAESEETILRCLKIDPGARFQSISEVSAALAPKSVKSQVTPHKVEKLISKLRTVVGSFRGKRSYAALSSLAIVSLLVGWGTHQWRQKVHARTVAVPSGGLRESPGNMGSRVPQINEPLIPASVVPGGPGFTLTVNGTGFEPRSTVQWNGKALSTKFVSSRQLLAIVPAEEIAKPGTAWVTARSRLGSATALEATFLPVTEPTPSLFFSRTAYVVGSGTYNLALADFNGDGKLDLVTANREASTVSVLLGNGDGTLRRATSYEVGPWPVALAVGDFNGDGKPDIVTANSDDRTISVLLGNGDGTFRPAKAYTSGLEPTFIAVGDFNRDGAIDLAVANNGEGTVSILLGNGDGTFRPAVKYAGFANPDAVQVSDFNGDGDVDLVVANAGAATVGVLLGNGDGTFRSAINSPAGDSPSSIAVADLNGDGKADLAITNRDTKTVSVLLGKGDGTFFAPVSYNVTYYPRPVITGDFDGDGKLDLAVVNGFVGTVSILFGNGDGTFQRPANFGAGPNTSSVVAGDFNGDGRLDLAVTNFFAPATVSVLLQTPAVALGADERPFGNQHVGISSALAAAVALSNRGSATLVIARMDVTGPNAGDFSETNNCGRLLEGGSTCMIQIKFKPLTVGLRRAKIVITDNAPGSPHEFTVTGNGVK